MKKDNNSVVTNRHDILILQDVTNGVEQQCPDSKAPRIDIDTEHGVVTDAKIKRALRDRWQMMGFETHVARRAVRNRDVKAVAKELGIEWDDKKGNGQPKDNNLDTAEKLILALCIKRIDIRMFGGVFGALETQLRGPVQVGMGLTVDPIQAMEMSGTCVAVTTEKESKEQGGFNRTMYSRSVTPYGLYRIPVWINPSDAARTQFTEQDKELLFDGLKNLFELSRSSMSGHLAVQKVVVFEHDSLLGSAPSHKLFKRVKVVKKAGAQTPRSFDDYNFDVDLADLPKGITVTELVDGL